MTSYALVTGASSGIGRELARLLAKDGNNVVLVARRKPELEVLARELESTYRVTARVVPCDLGDAAARDALLVAVSDADIDILVNNAGFGSNGKFWENDAVREVGMVELNVTALTDLTRRLLPAMVLRGRGRILNIGSTAGFQPGPWMTTYYATKAFVNSFTQALAYELRGTGVTATVSCPGPVATEFGAIAGNDKSALFKKSGGVAEPAVIALEAYQAMLQGKPMIVHGARNKLAASASKVSPVALTTAIAASLNRRIS